MAADVACWREGGEQVTAGRFYACGGQLYPSVTTILRVKFPGPVAEDEAQQAEWDAKRDRGSEVHRLIASAPIGDETWKSLSGDVQLGLVAWQRFVWEYCYHAEQVEEELVDATLGYGGKPDSIGRIPKGRVLVDWKTGRLHKEYVRYQLGAYFGLYVARYPRRHIYGALGVHLDCNTGNYEVEAMSTVELERYQRKFMELVHKEETE
jgi:hypothetical protein